MSFYKPRNFCEVCLSLTPSYRLGSWRRSRLRIVTPEPFCDIAARNVRFMPPCPPVVIGTVGVPRLISSAVWKSSWSCLSRTAAVISSGTLRAAVGRAEFLRCLSIEHIKLLTNVDLRREARDLKMLVALLEYFPERHMRRVMMSGHIERRHSERICLDLKRLLSAIE